MKICQGNPDFDKVSGTLRDDPSTLYFWRRHETAIIAPFG
jgi:hypothetical protein